MINLFKESYGFNISIFNGEIPNDIADNLIQVDDNTYNELREHKLMWKNGELISNPYYEQYAKEFEYRTERRLKNRLRQIREPLLQAFFDYYKSNNTIDNDILVWYQKILDLDETALDNIPEQVKKYL